MTHTEQEMLDMCLDVSYNKHIQTGGETNMSQKEKKILEAISAALPNMSEMGKGYFLGYAEAIASKKDSENKGNEPDSSEKAMSSKDGR